MTYIFLISTIIITAAVLFTMLFMWIRKNAGKEKLARQQDIIADIIWKNKLEITEIEMINDYLFAIDKSNLILLYINFRNLKEEVVLIDLLPVSAVKVNTGNQNVCEEIKGKTVRVDKHVAKIQLGITFGYLQPNIYLDLHESKNRVHDVAHIKARAEHWKKSIDQCLEEIFQSSRQLPVY